MSVLESGGSCAKVILFELCKSGVRRKIRTKSSIFKLKVWNWKEVSHEMLVLALQTFKVRVIFAFCMAGARFWKLLAWKVEDASHEMLILKASCLKSWGSLARNARFRRFLPEKLKMPRTKCSFWKLVAWKVEEASHEVLVFDASYLKSGGSLARNARFGSLLLEELRFWKLL